MKISDWRTIGNRDEMDTSATGTLGPRQFTELTLKVPNAFFHFHITHPTRI